VRSRISIVIAVLATLTAASALAARARPVSATRRVGPRTGLLLAREEELVRAVQKKDRAAIERLAARMGAARLGDALGRNDAAVVRAALVALPTLRGAVVLIGAVAEQLDSPLSSKDGAVAVAAASALGHLLDGTAPSALDDWEVPPDQVGRACGALRALAARVEAPVPSRLAALGALADAGTVCTATAELTPLLRDPVPAVKRAVALLLRPDERQVASALRETIHDPDPAVASAAVAAVCRAEPPAGAAASPAATARPSAPAAGRKVAATPPAAEPLPLPQEAASAARALVAAPSTPPEDAVEMLACLAHAATPADRQLLDQLRREGPAPLRDRAAELADSPDRLKPPAP
jgi:hypothetical protein